MPAWTSRPAGPEGQVKHELDGQHIGAHVLVDPLRRITVVSVAMAVPGTDDATVDRCKERAERLLIEARRGEVR